MTRPMWLFAVVVTGSICVLTVIPTREVALASGYATPITSWLVPMLAEGCAALMTLIALRAERARFECGVIAVCVSLAILANLAHVLHDQTLVRATGILLSVACPLIFVATVHSIHRTDRAQKLTAEAAEAKRAAASERARKRASQRSTVSAQRERSEPLHAVGDERAEVVAQALTEGLTGAQLGERLGVSAATGRRLLADARARQTAA